MFGTLPELAQRPRERRLLRLHGQRRLEAAAGVHPGGALRRDLLPRPARLQEKEAIWRLYLEKFGLDPDQQRPSDRDFTGAEIRACCRLAGLLDIPLVGGGANIVPVAITAGEIGGAAAELGQRPVPVCGPAGHLLAGLWRGWKGKPERSPWRPIRQLIEDRPPSRSRSQTSSLLLKHDRDDRSYSSSRVVRRR